MNQHSNETITARYRNATGASLWESPWVRSLASFQSLLTHIATMFGVTAGFALFNLIVDPGNVWSRAILVIWLVLLIAHAVGIVILRLLNDDATRSSGPPRTWGEPALGPFSPWARAMAENPSTSGEGADGGNGAEKQDDPWKTASAGNGAADLSWPEPATTETDAPARGDPDNGDDRVVDGGDRVPWRAATEIAWMRRRRGAEGESEANRQDSAS